MKAILPLVVLGMLLSACGQPQAKSAISAPGEQDAAVAAALSWLALVDAEDYAQSWEGAADFFRGAVSREQWVQAMQGMRRPLGANTARKVRSTQAYTALPGAPDGRYVVVQFTSAFANKSSCIETVTPMQQPDGSWRVSGYYMN